MSEFNPRDKSRTSAGKTRDLVRKHTDPPRLDVAQPDGKLRWQWFTIELLESPAFRTLSGNAFKAFLRISIEHTGHAALENGRLIVTHAQFVALRPAPSVASMGQANGAFLRIPSKSEWQEALKIDVTGLKQSGDEASQKVAEGGRAAGQAIEESAAFFKVAGVDVGSAIMSAAEKLLQAANKFNNAQITVANAAMTGRPKINADTGRSMLEVATGGGGGY